MATNYHHHQCHCLPTPTPTNTPTPTPTPTPTTCYCTMCYTTTHYPSPPPPQPDPLIHSITSLHHHHHPPQIHQHPPPQNHHTQHYNHYPPPPPPQIHQNHHFHAQENPPPINTTVSSLIHRIAALESSLRSRKHSPPSSPLRDAAARTIQTHFRAYLVRRSRTLRHLKHLTHIKSTLNHLKSSVSNKTHFDSSTLYRESMNLLIKLESLQGSDPMIRDGKRSISRKLIRFMELIDEMCMEKQVIAFKNVRFGKNNKKAVIRIGGLTGKSQPLVKKNVRFDEDGNVYRLFKSSRNKGSSDGDDEEVEEIGVCSKETEVVEDDESLEMSENEVDPRKNLRTRIHHMTKKNQPDEGDDDDDDDEDDSFVFSAPLPAKMEY